MEETNHDEMDNYLADLNSEESDMDSIYSDSTDIHTEKSLPDELKVQCEANQNIKKGTEELQSENMFDGLNKQLFEKLHKETNVKMAKLRKISVAPGEKSKFQNSGEDIFLEEKWFPDLFPFGHGGNLSSIANEKKENSGFAATKFLKPCGK